jgi:hypothetical protein
MTEEEIIALYKSKGYTNEAAIRADIAAGNWQAKVQEWTGGGGSSGGGSALSDFSFDYNDAYTKAYEQLKPYYQKVLDLAQGDLELAKRIIQSDYDLGMRETRSEYEANLRQQALDFPQEQRRLEADWSQVNLAEPKEVENMQTAMNRRGILTSGIATAESRDLAEAQKARRAGMTTIQELNEAQKIRSEAIKRALDEKESRLVAGKGFGEEKEQRGYDTTRLRTGQEHSREASGLTESQFQKQLALQGAGLAKTKAQEASRLAGISSGVTQDILQKYGYNV